MVRKGKVFSYTIGDALYLNITNQCQNQCVFCVRETCEGIGQDSLWLEREPEAQEVIESIDLSKRYSEIVFCGFGEPLTRIQLLKEIAAKLKYLKIPIRVNTNGLANMVHGRNVVPELVGLIDSISISLNADNEVKYQDLCRSVFGSKGYQGVLDFARECVGRIPKVTITAVERNDIDLIKCERIAKQIGADFRVRKWNPDL